MKKILIIHKDEMYAEFISHYLDASGFVVGWATNNVEGFTMAVKMKPDLIIMSKESEYLDLGGFLLKKKHNQGLSEAPIFLVGNFSPHEIADLKPKHIHAFLSVKLNPRALIERIYLYFSLPRENTGKRTPMMMDIHSKGNILIIQIEGNFDPEQLVTCNFLLRLFCKKRKITTPYLMFIIPSIYEESLTEENLDRLFSFIHYKELRIKAKKIQILSNLPKLRELVSADELYSGFEFAEDYVSAYKELIADFNIETVIPLDFMEIGNVFTLDLYDRKGNIVLAANMELTVELLENLKKQGHRSLKYYSDVDISQITFSAGSNVNAAIFDYITREFSPLSMESFDMEVLQQKQNLFFSRLRNHSVLQITRDRSLYDFVEQTMSQYFQTQVSSDLEEISRAMGERRWSIIFIDLSLEETLILSVMREIRKHASRRKTTIILLASKLNKAQLIRYMKAGTDHVILHPFTTNKLFSKVYASMTEDRGN
jgi:DNA-binding response OmpR family regulator